MYPQEKMRRTFDTDKDGIMSKFELRDRTQKQLNNMMRRLGLEQKANQKTRDPNIKRRPKPRRGPMLKKDEH